MFAHGMTNCVCVYIFYQTFIIICSYLIVCDMIDRLIDINLMVKTFCKFSYFPDIEFKALDHYTS